MISQARQCSPDETYTWHMKKYCYTREAMAMNTQSLKENYYKMSLIHGYDNRQLK